MVKNKDEKITSGLEDFESNMKKYEHKAHVGGICPETGKRYESRSSWDNQPASLRPVGGDRYCSECHSPLPC